MQTFAQYETNCIFTDGEMWVESESGKIIRVPVDFEDHSTDYLSDTFSDEGKILMEVLGPSCR